MSRFTLVGLVLAAAGIIGSPGRAEAARPFRIQILDEATGRGVPLVELRTVNEIRHVTDSAGNVAFAEPGLMDRSVFFFVESHGYEFPKDGFGIRGKALDVTPGGRAELKIQRINVAERLYRVTGAGIYRDTVLLGAKPPIRQPVLNAQVLGSDSVMNAVFQGRLYWFWGDTNRPSYPLGNFHTTGATSQLPANGGIDPAVGVDLEYFTDDTGFAREMAHMEGQGPTWIGGLVVLRDGDGDGERMFAAYSKIKGMLDVYRRGIIEYDPRAEQFRHVADVPLDAPAGPAEHTVLHRDGDTEYVYFATPFPLTRVRATPAAYSDHRQYETFTCLVEGSRLDEPRIDRDEQGQAVYAWRRNTPAVGPEEQQKLIAAGVLEPDEALLQLRDIETGQPVTAHRGSVYWNDHRHRWVLIATQIGGDRSFLGEVWYAEADTLRGPWVYARRIVTHDKYSFYNPKQHPYFAEDGGRRIYFEGTYTTLFSGREQPTPRYEYNQIMYRLDLADARLNLPVAVYDSAHRGRAGDLHLRSQARNEEPNREAVAFFALDRPGQGTVPIVKARDEQGNTILRTGTADADDSTALFHALPTDHDPDGKPIIALYEYRHPDGTRVYSVDPNRGGDNIQRKLLCHVWPSR